MSRQCPGRTVASLGVMVILALSGCGRSSGGVPSSDPLASCSGTLTVATDLPTGGSETTVGMPMQNAAALAVEQANSGHLLGGCTASFVPRDDTSPATGRHDPARGRANMEALVKDPMLVGVIGTYNSGVALTEIPVANAAYVPMISPGNTNPGLTIPGGDSTIDTAALRPTGVNNYFRVIGNDRWQTLAIATVARNEYHLQNVFLLDDDDTAGLSNSVNFTHWFTTLGGSIVASRHIAATTTGWDAVAQEVKRLGADGVVDEGVASAGGGLLRAALARADVHVSFLGQDGIVDDQTIADAGTAAVGMVATSATDTTRLPTAQEFVLDYKQRFGSSPTPFSAYAFDAMNVLLDATRRALQAGNGRVPADPVTFRKLIIDRIRTAAYDGATGKVVFDQYGDVTNHAFSVYEVRSGGGAPQWAWKETISPAAP